MFHVLKFNILDMLKTYPTLCSAIKLYISAKMINNDKIIVSQGLNRKISGGPGEVDVAHYYISLSMTQVTHTQFMHTHTHKHSHTHINT